MLPTGGEFACKNKNHRPLPIQRLHGHKHSNIPIPIAVCWNSTNRTGTSHAMSIDFRKQNKRRPALIHVLPWRLPKALARCGRHIPLRCLLSSDYSPFLACSPLSLPCSLPGLLKHFCNWFSCPSLWLVRMCSDEKRNSRLMSSTARP